MNKRHYEHTLPNIRGSLSNTYAQYQFFRVLPEFENSLQSFDFKCHNFSSFIKFNNIPCPFVPCPSCGIPSENPDIPHTGLP